MPGFPAVFDLLTLNGANGFKLAGAALDRAGSSVAAGDINGDGFSDIIVGAPANGAGRTYVVYGKASGFGSGVSLDLLTADQGCRIDGVTNGDSSGSDAAAAGDVNGDGIGDLIIGAPNSAGGGSQCGSSHVVFGKSAVDGGLGATLTLDTLSGANGFSLTGEGNFDRSGSSVSAAGDVNGDGFDDIIVGSNSIYYGQAICQVVFGKASGFSAGFDLASLDGSNGFKIKASMLASSNGFNVSSAGDINGDGLADVIVGWISSYGSTSSVIFGRPSGFPAVIEDATLNGNLGFRIVGGSAADLTGRVVAAGGDINGDGLDDLLVSGFRTNANGLASGASYVIFGRHEGYDPLLDVASLDGTNGFKLKGESAYDYSGYSLSSAGDINGDGFDDVIVGAHGSDSNGNASGKCYVVFGKASGFLASFNLWGLNGSNGFAIEGPASGDALGNSVSSAGDVNGDGFDDLVIGASGTNANSGACYVIFGKATGTLNRVGTEGDDILSGGEWDDTFAGLGGNDLIRSGAGDDTISGSAGRDTIDGGDGNDNISGGSERDTFIVSAGEDHYDGGSEKDAFDFTAFGRNAMIIDLATGMFLHINGEDISTFVSVEDVKGTSGADTILGSFVNNSLFGRNGSDSLDGREGNDRLTGGKGQDTQSGGSGKDQFIFLNELDSGAGASQSDTITDFEVVLAANGAFTDRIDLSSVDAVAGTGGNQAFTFIGGANFTAEGQIRATQSGADTVISINTTGTGGADMKIVLASFDAANLSEADFIL